MPLISMLLGGCLQKAKTSISALGSVSLPSPQLDASMPPDFENAQDKGFVRFRGSCLFVINGFQIQFIQSNGEISDWFNIPAAAPAELREAVKKSSYPLVSTEYDSSCEEDGRYDFWVTMNQIVDWVGGTLENLPEVSKINLRGISPFLTSNVLQLPLHDDSSDPEANTFNFYAGIYPVPIGVGYCQPFSVSLGHEVGTAITFKVKNSVVRTFDLTLESGLTFGSDFILYSTPDCSGTPLPNMATAVTFPVGVEHLQYSYKVMTIVSPEKNITLSENFNGVEVTREFKVKTDTALPSVYRVILAPQTFEFTGGDECKRADLIVVGSNGVATKDYPSNIVINVLNPDISKFQLRSSCDETGTSLSSLTTLEFKSGQDYKKTIYVQSLAGVSSSTAGEISLDEATSYISQDIPDLYINANLNADHLKITRAESLDFLFNHECYPFGVSLVDAGGVPIPASHQIKFKFTTFDEIRIFEDSDCSIEVVAGSERFILPSQTQNEFYWSRRQLSPVSSAYLAPTSSSRVEVDVLTPSLMERPYYVDNALWSLPLQKSPLDWLDRGRTQIFHWYHLPMAPLPEFDIPEFYSFESSEINQSGSSLIVYNAPVKRKYFNEFTEGGGLIRKLFRNIFDLSPPESSPFLWAANTNYNVNLSSGSGNAALIGSYLSIPSLTVSSKQQLFGSLMGSGSEEFKVMIRDDGGLQVEYYDLPMQSTHCATLSGVIQEGKWHSIFVRFSNISGVSKCAIFVDGSLESPEETLPAALQKWTPRMGSTETSDSLKAQILEILIDKDLTSGGTNRYRDSVIQDIHNEYFEKRYKPFP